MTVREHLVAARGDAVIIASPVLPAIDAAIAEVDALGAPPAWPWAWRRNRVVGQWYTLPGTAASLKYCLEHPQGANPPPGYERPADAPRNPNTYSTTESAIAQWCGLAFTDDGFIGTLPSGHNESRLTGWQNNSFGIKCKVDSPQWASIHPGTPWSTLAVKKPDGTYTMSPAICGPRYPDGLPCGRHTYLTQVYSRRLNKVFVPSSFAAAAIYTDPRFGSGPQMEVFDLATRTWAAPGEYPDAPFSFGQPAAVALDERSDDIWYTNKDQWARYIAAERRWHKFVPSGLTSHQRIVWYRNCFVDVERNEVVFHCGLHTDPALANGLVFVNCDTYAGRFVPFTGPAKDVPQYYSTIVKNEDSGKYEFVGGHSGTAPLSKVVEIDPNTGNSTILGEVPGPVNGCNNRYAYVRDLGCMLYQPAYGDLMFRPTR